jgi:maltokinase
MSGISELPDGLAELIPSYLGRQRWYAGSSDPAPGSVRLVDGDVVAVTGGGSHRLLQILVEAEHARYHLLIGERQLGDPAEFLNGHEPAVLGECGSAYYYDGTLDPEMALALLEVVTEGKETSAHVRPVTTEQSNTSLVYDDRIILKVFRRLAEGRNPDVEVTQALADNGFSHVAAPMATWRRDGVDLGFAQQFLSGGSEGWALALTSLRDFYAHGSGEPTDAGGDFGAEAMRLGRMTAEMHLALAAAFGVGRREDFRNGEWPEVIARVKKRLRETLGASGSADEVLERLRSVQDPGPAIRVHGDYHLGQVMRTDTGWYVLDFEGEPARPMEERLRPTSPL